MAQSKFIKYPVFIRKYHLFSTFSIAALITAIVLSLLMITAPAFSKDAAKKPQKAAIISKDAWTIICPKKKGPCSLYAHIKTDKNIIVSSITILKMKVKDLKSPKIIAIAMLPLGLHIPSGVTIKIDESISFKANLLDCKKAGCRAVFPVSDKIFNHMIIGDKIKVIILDSTSRKSLSLNYTLNNFGKSYKAFLAKKKL